MAEMTPVERIEYLELILGQLFWYTHCELILEYHELKKKMIPYWTVDLTSKTLGRSKPSVDRDMTLAKLIRRRPELKSCRNRSEVERVLDAEQSAGRRAV